MDVEEAARQMKEIIETTDTEGGHIAADDLMLKILREMGYGDMCDLFEKEEWWYA